MSIKALRANVHQMLRQAGVDNPGLEARVILRHVLHVSDADLIGGDEREMIPPEGKEAVGAIVQRRAAGEPLSRILGEREFHGLPFEVTPAVLDPRPDTETLVDAALKSFKTPPASILDLGTGSGCILISLLHEWKDARGVGVDRSPEALAVAKRNSERNGVADRARLIQGDWGAGLEEQFALIVSNPPYIPSQDIPNLDREVRNHDPILALDGGKDGLDAYRTIIRESKELLSLGGVMLFEIGIGQGPDVARLVANAGLSIAESICDLAGIERVLKIIYGDSGDN